MDFISLATEQRRFLRILDEMLGDDTDDRTSSTSSSSSTGGGGGAVTSTEAAAATSAAHSSSMVDSAVARPLFSQNAEAELYLLATNFLLYVALVIVVILVCRIYFPEALESRGQQPPRPRNYSYRVAEAQEVEAAEDYGSDDDDVDSVDILASSDGETNVPASSFLDFQPESLSRKQVLKRLVFCCIMLNVTFVMWGALQVRWSYFRGWRISIHPDS
jgi:hypothetical protein